MVGLAVAMGDERWHRRLNHCMGVRCCKDGSTREEGLSISDDYSERENRERKAEEFHDDKDRKS